MSRGLARICGPSAAGAGNRGYWSSYWVRGESGLSPSSSSPPQLRLPAPSRSDAFWDGKDCSSVPRSLNCSNRSSRGASCTSGAVTTGRLGRFKGAGLCDCCGSFRGTDCCADVPAWGTELGGCTISTALPAPTRAHSLCAASRSDADSCVWPLGSAPTALTCCAQDPILHDCSCASVSLTMNATVRTPSACIGLCTVACAYVRGVRATLCSMRLGAGFLTGTRVGCTPVASRFGCRVGGGSVGFHGLAWISFAPSPSSGTAARR